MNLKVVSDELACLKRDAPLAKGSGHFYFAGDEADDWVVRTVDARNISRLTLKEWIEQYWRLQALNQQIMKVTKPGKSSPQTGKPPRSTKTSTYHSRGDSLLLLLLLVRVGFVNAVRGEHPGSGRRAGVYTGSAKPRSVDPPRGSFLLCVRRGVTGGRPAIGFRLRRLRGRLAVWARDEALRSGDDYVRRYFNSMTTYSAGFV